MCGFAAVGFSRALYWASRINSSDDLPVSDERWWPAIGGLALGVIGTFLPRVLGVGYDTISGFLNDKFVAWAKFAAGHHGVQGGGVASDLSAQGSADCWLRMFMTVQRSGCSLAFATGTESGLIPGAHLAAARSPWWYGGGIFGAAPIRRYRNHHLRFRDHPRLQLGVAADAGVRRRQRYRAAIHAVTDWIMTERLARATAACPSRLSRRTSDSAREVICRGVT